MLYFGGRNALVSHENPEIRRFFGGHTGEHPQSKRNRQFPPGTLHRRRIRPGRGHGPADPGLAPRRVRRHRVPRRGRAAACAPPQRLRSGGGQDPLQVRRSRNGRPSGPVGAHLRRHLPAPGPAAQDGQRGAEFRRAPLFAHRHRRPPLRAPLRRRRLHQDAPPRPAQRSGPGSHFRPDTKDFPRLELGRRHGRRARFHRLRRRLRRDHHARPRRFGLHRQPHRSGARRRTA